MADVPAILGALGAGDGVIKALYNDLAAPGVRQVGMALETVLKTGNLILLPLRMLNAHAAEYEQHNFEEIANRFKDIPEVDIVDIRPEIGAPILDKLSVTHDPDLRKLFIELLATAADKKKVSLAHPSFVKVIESICPDEALLIKAWKETSGIPCLTIRMVGEGTSYQTLRDLMLISPVELAAEDMLPVYIANMAGLGLVAHRTDAWLSTESLYQDVIDKAKSEFPGLKDGSIAYMLSMGSEDKLSKGDVVYEKAFVDLLAYGRAFQAACI